MKRIIYFLLIVPAFLSAFQRAFFEDEDPSLYYHVNVVTGHLNLGFEDAVIQAPIPFPIIRTYSSSGALELDESIDRKDLYFKNKSETEWMFVGGWNLISHCYLLLYADPSCKKIPTDTIRNSSTDSYEPPRGRCFRAYVAEPSGKIITYECSSHEQNDIWLKPKISKCKNFGELSSRKNSQNNRLKISKNQAILYLPDGGVRLYKGKCSEYETEECCCLELEILPNKHRVAYFYDQNRLSRIEMQNPAGNKVFASIDFSEKEFRDNKVLHLGTSEGQTLTYKMMEFKGRSYFQAVSNNRKPSQQYGYQPGRKSLGARINAAWSGSQERLRVEYYLPETKDKENKWVKRPRKVPIRGDKVKTVYFPEPETGSFIPYAFFYYEKNVTDVWDVDGIKTRYHHDGENLTAIEYFDENERKFSLIKYDYKDGLLQAKSLEDSQGNCQFSKSFKYDKERNIVEEIFQDHRLHNALLSKIFTYYPKTFLLKTEEEQGGVITHFAYLNDTDLISSKCYSSQGKIFQREYFFYNEDHLLTCKIVDDGTSSFCENLSDVTERHIERYRYHPQTGLCVEKKNLYLDLNTGQESSLITTRYHYNEKNQITKEIISDTQDQVIYVLINEYDTYGQLIKRTSPLGRMNTYAYDDLGRLIRSKEVGKLQRQFTYDHANHPIMCREGSKVSYSQYDRKGQLVEQIDKRGNVVRQVYDCFGRSIQTHFPQAIDENKTPYLPIVHFTYDLQGNLTSTTNPKGETTSITYTSLRKPLKILWPDGSLQINHYNADGTLAVNIDEEGTETHYAYDALQRLLTKTIFGSDKTLLSSEHWTYNAFHLISYQNPQGLLTTYTYDGAGRKIAESAGDRTINYTYDALGNIERTQNKEITLIALHNTEGEIIEQWEEDTFGRIENHMWFFYDLEGRKIKAHRTTSQGLAKDIFIYDEEGRLVEHRDPHNERTRVLYEEIKDPLGQKVDQKIEINALGHRTLETFDAQGRLQSIERQDAEENTVAMEEHLYDRAGNKAKRVTSIYHHKRPLRTHTTEWDYNERGWPIKETEENAKITRLLYDRKGRLIEKVFPSQIHLYQAYDGLDRLIELKCSDDSIHYQYTYENGPYPTGAQDLTRHLIWQRIYNPYCQLLSESGPDGSVLSWEYDSLGRCTELNLPDSSSIHYVHQGLHLQSVTRTNKNKTSSYTHTYLSFDSNGHVQQETLINNLGLITSRHDLLERPQKRQTPWYTLELDYGPTSLVTKQSNTLFVPKNYSYDPLDQLTKEGPLQYDFDSLGNPRNCQINALNQIIAKPGHRFIYSSNGELINQIGEHETFRYEYDALGRLTDISKSNQMHIKYTYDPFSRLHTKTRYENENTFWTQPNTWSVKIITFLHDKDIEIGSYKDPHNILELKVLGLGRPQDIGGAISLEMGSEIYVPLHDFNGHMIALLDSKGTLIEKWDPDAFGQNISKSPSRSPWRYNSKRSEEHLIYFGCRFYDPQLGRWLTPDPAGSIDSPNLYLYVRNSPLNRLDLFGLWSETYISEFHIDQIDRDAHYVIGKAFYHEHSSDLIVHCWEIDKLKFTPEEHDKGTFDIFKHFQDVLPKEGTCIGAVTFINGIEVSFDQFNDCFLQITKSTPGSPLFIGQHNPPNGMIKDVGTTLSEIGGKENKDTIMVGQLLSTVLHELNKVNPDLLHVHVAHSRGGATTTCGMDHLPIEDQLAIKKSLIFIGVAPAHIPRSSQVKEAVTFYSKLDPVTKRFGERLQFHHVLEEDGTLKYVRNPDYNIQFIPASVQWYQVGKHLEEHSFLGNTCQRGLGYAIRALEKDYGFYRGNQTN